MKTGKKDETSAVMAELLTNLSDAIHARNVPAILILTNNIAGEAKNNWRKA